MQLDSRAGCSQRSSSPMPLCYRQHEHCSRENRDGRILQVSQVIAFCTFLPLMYGYRMILLAIEAVLQYSYCPVGQSVMDES